MSTIAVDGRKWNDFGIGTYVRCLVAALARHQGPHDLVLLLHPETVRQGGGDELPAAVRTLPVAARSYSLRELVELGPVLRRAGVDLYHSTHYPLPLRPPCPTVVTVHDLIHLLFPQFLPGGPRRLAARLYASVMLRRSARLAERIITPSRRTALDLQRHLAVPPEKIDAIPNGVSSTFLAPQAQDAVERTLAALAVRRPYVLFVGNPKPHKNLEGLLAALARWRREDPAGSLPDLVCAGIERQHRGRVERLANEHGLPRPRLLGVVDEVTLAHLYTGCEQFAFPSLYEGFGLPVAEAMACGAPVVTSKLSSLPEVAGDAALLVDPSDEMALAAAMRRLHEEPELRQELARRGRTRAGELSWELAAQRTAAVYEEALTAPHRRRQGGGA